MRCSALKAGIHSGDAVQIRMPHIFCSSSSTQTADTERVNREFAFHRIFFSSPDTKVVAEMLLRVSHFASSMIPSFANTIANTLQMTGKTALVGLVVRKAKDLLRRYRRKLSMESMSGKQSSTEGAESVDGGKGSELKSTK